MDEPIVKTRFSGIDLVKVIATILILLHHYQQIFEFWQEGKLNFFNGNFNFSLMVDVFFIVSGFLMQNSNARGQLTFGKFFKRKYFRFFPICFLATSFCTVMQWAYLLTFHHFFLDNLPGNPIGIWNYIVGISLFHTGWGINIGLPPDSPTWYISVLLICYIVFWMANDIEMKAKFSANVIYVFMIILGINIRTKGWNFALLNNNTARGYICFFIGAILYQILLNYEKVMQRIIIILVLVLVLGIITKQAGFYSYFRDDLYYILVFLIFPGIISVFYSTKWIDRIGSTKLISILSRSSFEAFVWHVPLLQVINFVICFFNIQMIHNYLTMSLFVVIVLAISVLLYKYLELPINDWVNKTILKENQEML